MCALHVELMSSPATQQLFSIGTLVISIRYSRIKRFPKKKKGLFAHLPQNPAMNATSTPHLRRIGCFGVSPT